MGQGPSAPGPPDTEFKVIGAGLSRTGTKTLAHALSILYNAPAHDTATHAFGGTRAAASQWLEIMRLVPTATTLADHKRVQYLLAKTLQGYICTTDVPGVFLTRELRELYPDAAVVVTTRDTESWWRSLQRMTAMSEKWWMPLLVWPLPRVGNYGVFHHQLRVLNKFATGQDGWTPESLERHNQALKEEIPGDKLLFYEVRDGWEPLCKFLDMPVPDVPFPHENDPDAARKAYLGFVAAGIMAWTAIACSIVVPGALAWKRFTGKR